MILQIFLGMGLAQASTKHSEVLAKNKNRPAIDSTVAGHHAVTRDLLGFHVKLSAAVALESVPFPEGIFVKEQGKSLPRRKLSFLVLFFDSHLASPK